MINASQHRFPKILGHLLCFKLMDIKDNKPKREAEPDQHLFEIQKYCLFKGDISIWPIKKATIEKRKKKRKRKLATD